MNYIIDNYGQKNAFSSFLPGIAGIKGIPVWCYYVNRGQGVVSFGVDNKDHAIMEFYPAHMAYQNVKKTGFRTFIRRNDKFFEPFSDEKISHKMEILMNGLAVSESNCLHDVDTRVNYFVLPEESVGALVRKVEIVNTGSDAHFEIIDGMPNAIPFGVGQDSMKNMTQTAKAWMQVEDYETGVPFYRVRVSMDDTAQVSGIEGGNFAVAFDENGKRLECVCDGEAVFGYDLSLGYPANFADGGMSAVDDYEQNVSNLLPTAFFKKITDLKQGESIVFYELIGQVNSKDVLNDFLPRIESKNFFSEKEQRANSLINEITDVVETKTADANFDAYTRYTYMDNVLRGGLPIKLPGEKVFYVYSRKHGDLERDYNYFSMLPEFYSQGNGNFRDVNQNRRCDTFFEDFVGTTNIRTFYSLIQLDGHNPLSIDKTTYTHPEIRDCFTPGQLYELLAKKYDGDMAEKEFERIISEAKGTVNATFGEGYWSDHWTYNLDLIEEFLEIYPDKKNELLLDKSYTYFLSQANINPRRKRYAKTENGIRQYYSLDKQSMRNTAEKVVTVDGKIYEVTLLEKLVLLCTIKFAALDPYGMGIEMEGGKPGWYDALNGLPGMLGSSMAETYELKRMLSFVLESLKDIEEAVEITEEVFDLLNCLFNVAEKNISKIKTNDVIVDFWDEINDAKEAYRSAVYEEISGKKVLVNSDDIAKKLSLFDEIVMFGIEKAKRIFNDNVPTYFSYDVVEFDEDNDGIYPKNFKVGLMPNFLEGPVRYLKLDVDFANKKKLYDSVKNSDLYDDKLNMYKVNAALEQASYEIGRCRAFTPGWLENESIWLHMEYKYLLEILKSGLYEEFINDFKKAAVPFLDEKVYGRSILENSSFIVSSKNPNRKIHGKGNVARLSGSTIEFISMWKHMMFGKNIFSLKDGAFSFMLSPLIPEYLVPEDGLVCAKFLGKVDINYVLKKKKNYIPGEYSIKKYVVTCLDGKEMIVNSNMITGELAYAIRDKKVSKIEVYIN